MHVSGYVNAVERDSKVLPAVMSPGARGSFVERVAAGAFGRAVERNPDIRMLFNHEREIGSVKGGQLRLTEDNIGLRAEAVVTDPEAVNAAKRGELRGWSFGFSEARDIWEDYKPGIQRRTLTDFDLLEVSLLTKSPAYYGTSVETRGDTPLYRVVEIRGEDESQADVSPTNAASGAPAHNFGGGNAACNVTGEETGTAAQNSVSASGIPRAITSPGESRTDVCMNELAAETANTAEEFRKSAEKAAAALNGLSRALGEQRAAFNKAKASAEYYKRTIEFLETGGF